MYINGDELKDVDVSRLVYGTARCVTGFKSSSALLGGI